MFFLAAATAPGPDAAAGALTVGQIVIIVIPATIALVGVIVTVIVSSINANRAEDRRAKNAVAAQLIDAGRTAELEGLHAVGTAVADLKAFHRSMYGNTGQGQDDARSAAAMSKLFESFEGLDDLTKSSLNVPALGDPAVSSKIRAIRTAIVEYIVSLGEDQPKFIAAKAVAFETEVDKMVAGLIDTVRADFGTDAARVIRPKP